MAKTQCILHKIPPEIRDAIYIILVKEWLDAEPHHHSRHSVNGGCGRHSKLLDLSLPLERALIPDKTLFREIFVVRIKMSTIFVNTMPKPRVFIANMSPLVKASIRSVSVGLRPLKWKKWPQSLGGESSLGYKTRERIEHVLGLVESTLATDITCAQGLTELTLNIPKAFISMEYGRDESREWKLVDLLQEKLLRNCLRGCVNALSDLTTITLMGAWKGERQPEFNLLREFLKENLQGEEIVKKRRDGTEWNGMIGATFAAPKGGRLTWVKTENQEALPVLDRVEEP